VVGDAAGGGAVVVVVVVVVGVEFESCFVNAVIVGVTIAVVAIVVDAGCVSNFLPRGKAGSGTDRRT
jgi:hypothetical protein